jgi:hypothetical protein
MMRNAERVASVSEPEHLMLTRPSDRRIEQAGDADAARQPTVNGCLDQARCKEGQRDRHLDMALAAGFACGDAVDCRGAGLDLGKPLPAPCDCGDELYPAISADRTASGW